MKPRPTEEHLRVAREIAARFGETEERPIAQIARMVQAMGVEWVQVAVYATLDAIEYYRRFVVHEDGTQRTQGGVFFEVARQLATASLHKGLIDRRTFFRCFTDHPPQPKKPRPPKPPASKPVRKVTSPRVPRSSAWRGAESKQPEVYVTVRGKR